MESERRVAIRLNKVVMDFIMKEMQENPDAVMEGAILALTGILIGAMKAAGTSQDDTKIFLLESVNDFHEKEYHLGMFATAALHVEEMLENDRRH